MEPDVDIAALVRSAQRRGTDDARLTGMVRRLWPRASDATQPAALAWVRAWGPARLTAPAPECACDAGRCRWCN